jgi:cysteine desulfurase
MDALVYLDHAASSPPSPAVVEALVRATRELYGNPSSAHRLGAAAERALAGARQSLADALGVAPAELVFTSGGTEANALAIAGVAARSRGRHVVVSALEHAAVQRNVEALVARGWQATVVAPDSRGIVGAEAVAAALRPDTALVCLMAVNNEVGTRQPCAEVAALLASGRPRPHLHVDAVQAFGHGPLRPARLGADSVAVSAHKIGGPKGAGALWLRPGARIAPLWEGGGQERGLRAGTENVPALVAFGVAADEIARLDGETWSAWAARRDRFEALCQSLVPAARATTPGAPRSPHICSLRLPGLPAEPLLHALEARGVIASAGSACAARAKGQSHVLKALGVPETDAVLRFSLGLTTDDAELARAAEALAGAVADVGGVAKNAGSR